MPAKLTVPAPSELRDAYLRVVRTELVARGVANPNVGRDSDHWIHAEAIAQQLAILYANQQLSADQTMPDTAEDDDLVRILKIFNLQDVGAAGSAGPVVFNSSASSFVASGSQISDSRGQFFQVTVGATYANGANIPIAGLTTGKATNLPQGTVLQWVTPPTFSANTALVGVGGLIGGADSDTNETRRNRLYSFFRNPRRGGNWSQIAQWAADSSPSVQAGYVYPAINGPATVGVCVVGPLSFDNTNGWSRGVSDSVLTTATNFIAAQLPEGINLVVTTPKDTGGATPDIDADVAIGISLPLPVSGGGLGGGWRDPLPWPAILGTSSRVYVSGVTSSTVFTLTSDDAATTPSTVGLVVGSTTIGWFSNAQYAAGGDPIVIGTVTNVSGSTGSLTVTVDTPFTGIAVNDHVMPNAERIQDYANAFLAAMNQMGPGQWTSHAQILASGGKRRPYVTASNPSDFGSVVLRAISDVGEEVLDVQYTFRALISPGVPSNTTTTSPFIFVPRRFSFVDKIQ